MCCAGKCLFFIPVKTGSLIFGYVIAVISASGTIACTIALLYLCVEIIFSDPYRMDKYFFIVSLIITTAHLIELLSSFVCSVLLLVGINKNKPSFVATFIIYGMIQVVLLFIFFVTLHCMRSWFVAGLLFVAMAIIGIYALCIYMVFLAYQQLNSGLVFENPPVNADLVQLEDQAKAEV